MRARWAANARHHRQGAEEMSGAWNPTKGPSRLRMRLRPEVMIPTDEIPNLDVTDSSLKDIRPGPDEGIENAIDEEASGEDPYDVDTRDTSVSEVASSSQREIWQDMSQGSIGQVMVAEAAQVIGSQLKRSLALPWQVGFKGRRLGMESITDQLRHQLRVHEVGALDVSQSEGQDPAAEVGLVERQSPFILRRLCRARVARSECDIRNLALKKLKSILLLDLEASSLGRSLTTRAGQLASEEELGRSIEDAFRSKASTTLQKRASALIRFFPGSSGTTSDPLSGSTRTYSIATYATSGLQDRAQLPCLEPWRP